MVKYEQILIDPSPGEVAECLALAAAAADAGARERKLGDQPAKWRKMAREAIQTPEGMNFSFGGRTRLPASHLMLCWWSDGIGRKHFVVRGRRLEDRDTRDYFDERTLALRPPLWHCYPNSVLGLPTQRDVRWVVQCGCGAVGTPESLAWMGGECGACFDRRHDGSDILEEPRALHAGLPSIQNIDFSEHGIAASGGGNTLLAWPCLRAGPVIVTVNECHYISSLSYSTGEILIDAIDDGPKRPPIAIGFDGATRPLADSDCVLYGVGSPVLRHRDGRITSVDGTLLAVMHNDGPPLRILHAGAKSIEADSLQSLILYILEPSLVVREIRFPSNAVPPSPETLFWGQYNPELGVVYAASGKTLLSIDIDTGRAVSIRYSNDSIYSASDFRAVGNFRGFLRLTPDMRYLIGFDDERTMWVYSADNLVPIAAFAWHLGKIHCSTVHSNRNLVATAGVEGAIKLWDLDRLLPAVAPP